MPQRLLLFDPLIGRGETGELEGRLAESWEASDDFLTWTVRLDPEARWHDGEPVTVRDIEFTLRLVSDPDIGYLRAESYTFETIDEHTYRIRHHPGPSRLPHGTCEADFWSRPVGTGPYRWVRAEPQVVVELEANPDYHGPLPAIPRVLFRCWQATPTRRSASSPRKRLV
jgi:peptide/nickel transport system substrate-binding protein